MAPAGPRSVASFRPAQRSISSAIPIIPWRKSAGWALRRRIRTGFLTRWSSKPHGIPSDCEGTPVQRFPHAQLVFRVLFDHTVHVNTASQNLAHHLGVLREKLQHATEYEQALYYFLAESAGDARF